MTAQTFTVRNFKGCREITLTPTGRLVVIAGANGAGKSSFIDAFVELFDPKGAKLTPKPIRDGASEAVAEFRDEYLGILVRRVWKKDGTAGTLTVEALDGAKYSSPAKFVADLLGGAIFDPVAFLNLDEKKQRDALLEKVQLPFDLDALAREKAGAADRRLIAGREVKRLEGALGSLPKPSPDSPAAEVSSAQILAALQDAQTHNLEVRRAADLAVELSGKIVALEQREEELQEQIRAMREERARLDLHRIDASNDADAELIDLEPIQERLRGLDAINQAVRDRQAYEATAAELSEAQDAHAAAQAEIDSLESGKRRALAEAVFPVDGLSVDEEGVTFDGIPFGQVNSAMRRRIAFAIATSGDPKLRLVIIKDGDLLDAESLAAIETEAEERGFTVLVERDRDESRKIGFTVVDGALADEAAA